MASRKVALRALSETAKKISKWRVLKCEIEGNKIFRFRARELSPKEQADLPTHGWKNPKVDTKRYYVAFTKSWEVLEDVYWTLINDGFSGQEINGKFIITNH